jgi:predicted aspartyl protease
MWHVMVDDQDIRIKSHVTETGVDIVICLPRMEAEKMGKHLIEAARILAARTDLPKVAVEKGA